MATLTVAGRTPPDAAATAPIAARLRAAGCVFAEREAALLVATGHTGDRLEELVAGRVSGRPLEHVLGWAGFAGLRIPVTDGVFVPRRRSEALARSAADAARACAGRAGLAGTVGGSGTVVVDLCCGAGALGAVVASRVPGVEVHAADIDAAAVECARRCLAPFGGRAHLGDLYAALPADLQGRVDVLVLNAPYVPTGEIAFLPGEARSFEPMTALDGGADGLDVLRRAVRGADSWLAPRATMLMECAAHQGRRLARAVAAAGLVPQVLRDEERDATVVIARRPRPAAPRPPRRPRARVRRIRCRVEGA